MWCCIPCVTHPKAAGLTLPPVPKALVESNAFLLKELETTRARQAQDALQWQRNYNHLREQLQQRHEKADTGDAAKQPRELAGLVTPSKGQTTLRLGAPAPSPNPFLDSRVSTA